MEAAWSKYLINYLAEIFGRNNIQSNTKSDRECEWVRGREGGKEGGRPSFPPPPPPPSSFFALRPVSPVLPVAREQR